MLELIEETTEKLENLKAEIEEILMDVDMNNFLTQEALDKLQEAVHAIETFLED